MVLESSNGDHSHTSTLWGDVHGVAVHRVDLVDVYLLGDDMSEFEIDRKRAIFTYSQFLRHIHPTFMHIRCPYCEKAEVTLFIDMEKDDWHCRICKFGSEVIWEEGHVIFKKEPV